MRYSHSKTLFLMLTCIGFLLSPMVSGEEGKKLYRVVDTNGNISYSDVPMPGGKEIVLKDVPSINIKEINIDFESLEEQIEAQREVSSDYYRVLEFAELVDDGVIRNNAGAVTLAVRLEPNLSKGHYLKFYLDGKLIKEQQKELSITAQEIEYGSHTVSFSVVSQNGVKVQDSATVKFNLLHIVRKKIGSTNL